MWWIFRKSNQLIRDKIKFGNFKKTLFIISEVKFRTFFFLTQILLSLSPLRKVLKKAKFLNYRKPTEQDFVNFSLFSTRVGKTNFFEFFKNVLSINLKKKFQNLTKQLFRISRNQKEYGQPRKQALNILRYQILKKKI